MNVKIYVILFICFLISICNLQNWKQEATWEKNKQVYFVFCQLNIIFASKI